MRAIILAAGEGTRLRPLTNDRPKCLVELLGRSLLERQVETLRVQGISDIVIIGGYRADAIDALGHRVVRNPEYGVTNMVATLFCAEAMMDGASDLIISYGDIVYEPRVLRTLLACAAPFCLAIDRNWRHYWEQRMENPLDDAETLKLDTAGRVIELGKKPVSLDDIQGQYMGLFKIRADRVAAFVAAYHALDRAADYDGKDFFNMYMTSYLQHLIDGGWQIEATPVDNGWLEVDTVEDLALYHRMHDRGDLAEFYVPAEDA